jgi:hypothetical protein
MSLLIVNPESSPVRQIHLRYPLWSDRRRISERLRHSRSLITRRRCISAKIACRMV